MADEEKPEVVQTTDGFSWRLLLSYAALGAAAVILFASVFIFKSYDPPFILMFLLLFIGALLARRTGKAGVTGVVLALLGSLMFVVFGGFFAVTLISVPEGAKDFIPVMSTLVFSLMVVVSAIALAIRGKGRGFEPSGASSAMGWVGVVLVTGLVGWSLYASSQFESVAAGADDVLVVTKDFEFTPDSLEADSGTVAIHVTNADDSLHTFTIDELGVDVSIPSGKSNRVEFDAEPGKYRFYCKPHAPDMEGELEVG